MQSLMDRITSLERMLHPVTQPAPRYMPHATAHVNSYSLQRPSVQFGPGNLQYKCGEKIYRKSKQMFVVGAVCYLLFLHL